MHTHRVCVHDFIHLTVVVGRQNVNGKVFDIQANLLIQMQHL